MFACLFKGHIWHHLRDINVFEDNYSTRPLFTKRVYQCERCLKMKKVKM